MTRFGLLLAASALALTGCASLNENECVTADWQSIGFQDGAQGQPVSASSRHRKACAKHGVTLDQYAYLQGHEQGVRTFCRPGKGFSLGAGGSSYAGVCPADLEPQFLAEYQKGRHLIYKTWSGQPMRLTRHFKRARVIFMTSIKISQLRKQRSWLRVCPLRSAQRLCSKSRTSSWSEVS